MITGRKLVVPLALTSALGLAGCSKEAVCAADETAVGGACFALQSDPYNCGRVGQACGADQGCSGGACVDCTSAASACVPAVVAACYNLDQVRPLAANLAPATAPIATDSGPIRFARRGGQLFVANSTSSTISALALAPPSATTGAEALQVPSAAAGFADLEHLAEHGGLLWASNAATGTLVALDPESGAAVDEIVLGSPNEFVNPQGIAFVGEKAYLALSGVNAVAVLDLSTVPGAAVTKRIDLSALGFGAANAAPTRVVAAGSRAYVTLNDLYDSSYQKVDGAHGRLAVIDASTDALAGEVVDLGPGCLNASGMGLWGTTLWVACGYFDFFGTKEVSGAALVPVELASGAPIVGTPVALTSALTSVVICGGRGYAGASDSGTVIAFDPADGTVQATALACPAPAGKSSFVPDLACAF